jgi:methyl-accepting chemotaxis protein
MKTSRFKVATLLTAGFGLVCAFIAAAIGLGLYEQAKLNDVTTEIAEERWPKIELTMNLQLRVTDIAVALRNAVLSENDSVQERQMQDIARFRKETQDYLAELDRTVVTPSGRTALQRIDQAMKVYAGGQDELIRMVKADRDADARAYLNESLKPMLQACREALSDSVKHEVGLMTAARTEAAEAYADTRLKMLAIGMVALLVSVTVATLIIRRLNNSLGGEPEMAAQTAARIAGGDLSGSIAVRQGDSSSLMYEMEHMREHLGHLVGQVRHDAEQIASASSEIAAGNLDLSARTEQQAAALEETAAAMEELSATVEQNNANAEQANQLAQHAALAAARGGEAVAAVTARMQDIADSAKKMAEIIGLIDGIAFQTNILALNAAVEAARAGDQGRGFAVVATEVRSLAQRSAAAAQQISGLITDATAQAAAGAEMVQQTGGAMDDIVASVARVEEIMAQIRNSSAEQHSGIVSCSRAVVEMDQGTQQNAALVEQVAAAAQSLQDQSARLEQAVSIFQIAGKTPQAARPWERPAAKRGARPALAYSA